MDFAPISLRLLLMFLVLGNGIILIAQSRLPSANLALPAQSAPHHAESSEGSVAGATCASEPAEHFQSH